jgi:hypothetical protein
MSTIVSSVYITFIRGYLLCQVPQLVDMENSSTLPSISHICVYDTDTRERRSRSLSICLLLQAEISVQFMGLNFSQIGYCSPSIPFYIFLGGQICTAHVCLHFFSVLTHSGKYRLEFLPSCIPHALPQVFGLSFAYVRSRLARYRKRRRLVESSKLGQPVFRPVKPLYSLPREYESEVPCPTPKLLTIGSHAEKSHDSPVTKQWGYSSRNSPSFQYNLSTASSHLSLASLTDLRSGP